MRGLSSFQSAPPTHPRSSSAMYPPEMAHPGTPPHWLNYHRYAFCQILIIELVWRKRKGGKLFRFVTILLVEVVGLRFWKPEGRHLDGPAELNSRIQTGLSVHIFLHFPDEMPLFVYIENTFSDIETIRTRRYSPLIITYFFDLWPQFIQYVHHFMLSFKA